MNLKTNHEYQKYSNKKKEEHLKNSKNRNTKRRGKPTRDTLQEETLNQNLKQPGTASSPHLAEPQKKRLHLPLIEGARAIRIFTYEPFSGEEFHLIH
jgi:hypothetical protein